jgi:hypothetical protein
MVGNIRELSITVVRSGKFKRKPFNLSMEAHSVTIATLAFSYPRVSSDRDRSISNPNPEWVHRGDAVGATMKERLPPLRRQWPSARIYFYFANVARSTSMPSLISSP